MKNQLPESVCVFLSLCVITIGLRLGLISHQPLLRIKLDLKYANENLCCSPHPPVDESQDRA